MSVRNADEVFDFMRYPAGEPHVTIGESVRELVNRQSPFNPNETISGKGADTYIGHTTAIIWEAYNFDDLALMVTAWRMLQRRFNQSKRFVVPYFPFGRHDRRRDEWDSDPLQMALDIVRPMLDANCLVTIDPHSDVSGVIPHISQRFVVEQFLLAHPEGVSGEHFDTIVIPDNGATKKSYEWAFRFPQSIVLQGHKKRNVRTGELTGFYVDSDDCILASAKQILIVDDICDGGGTFIGLADWLAEKCEGHEITLLTTHGLYTKGVQDLAVDFKLWTLDIYETISNFDVVNGISTKELVASALRTGNIR